MKEGCSGGASLCKGLHEGGLRGGFLYWGTQKMRFLRDMQNALSIGALLGNLEGVHLPGVLREKKSISGFLSWIWRPLRS